MCIEKPYWHWRSRWLAAVPCLTAAELGDVSDKELQAMIEEVLEDEPRWGAPVKFSAEQVAAAIVRQDVDSATANAARTFISYLTEPEQQKVFVQHGFRPASGGINLQAVANSPWSQNIPGAEVNPPVKTVPAPKKQVLGEIQRLWQRVN